LNLVGRCENGQLRKRSKDMPFSLYPMLIFGNFVDTLFHSLCPYSLDVPSTIIVDDSGNLRGPTDVFMGRKPTK
jgi:hypothetical protein